MKIPSANYQTKLLHIGSKFEAFTRCGVNYPVTTSLIGLDKIYGFSVLSQKAPAHLDVTTTLSRIGRRIKCTHLILREGINVTKLRVMDIYQWLPFKLSGVAQFVNFPYPSSQKYLHKKSSDWKGHLKALLEDQYKVGWSKIVFVCDLVHFQPLGFFKISFLVLNLQLTTGSPWSNEKKRTRNISKSLNIWEKKRKK